MEHILKHFPGGGNDTAVYYESVSAFEKLYKQSITSKNNAVENTHGKSQKTKI